MTVYTLHILAVGLAAVLWTWLMHTRKLPLDDGCYTIMHAIEAWYYYALLAVPVWYLVHGLPYTIHSNVILAWWCVGFTLGNIRATRNGLFRMALAVASILILLTTHKTPRDLLWCEAVVSLTLWDELLRS